MYGSTARTLILFFLMAAAGCAAGDTSTPIHPKGAAMNESGGLYFADPKTAVTVIAGLIAQSDWPALSRYYDLSGSDIDREELESGRFFVRTERPPVSHPGGFWRIRHPFDPRFGYRYHLSLSGDHVRVHLGIEIDQGGGMTQRGRKTFLLRKSEKGYRILPFETDEKDPTPTLVK